MYTKLLLLSTLAAFAVAETQVCNDCQLVAQYISVQTTKPEQLTRASKFMSAVCDTYTNVEDKVACANIVNHLPKIVAVTKPLLNNPLLMCTEANLCEREEPVHDKVAEAVHIAAQMVTSDKSALECGLCEVAMSFLNGMFGNLDLQTDILKGIQNFCGKLGKDLGGVCAQLVNVYVPKIFIIIEKDLANGPTTCAALNMCGATGKTLFNVNDVVSRIGMQVAQLDSVPSNDATTQFVQLITAEARNSGEIGKIACAVCKISMTGLLGYFEQDDKAIDTVADALRSTVCEDVLPSGYEPDCTDFLHIYLSALLKMTLWQVNPDNLCGMMQMCSA